MAGRWLLRFLLMVLAGSACSAAPYSSDEYLALRRKIGLAQYQTAREDCLRMMDNYPHDAVLHETFVEICLYAGQIEEAETVLRRRLAAGASVEQCLYAIGLSRYHRHLFRDALDAFTRSIRLGNTSPDCYKYMAYTLEKLYGVDEAIRRLSLMSHEESSNPQSWFALGLSHLSKGNYSEAESEFNEAIARARNEPAYWQMKAVSSYCAGALHQPENIFLALINAAEERRDISSVQFLRWYLLHSKSASGDESGWATLMNHTLDEAREYGQAHWLGWLQDGCAAHAVRHGDLREAKRASLTSLEMANLAGDTELAKGARRILIESLISSGEYGAALTQLGILVSDTASMNTASSRSDLFIDAGRLMNEVCRPDIALSLVVDGLVCLGRSRSDRRAEIREKTILGCVYENLADTISAYRNFLEAFKLAEKSGLVDRNMAVAVGNLGRQYLSMGSLSAADSLFRYQLSIAESCRFHLEEVSALINLADLSRSCCKFRNACRLYRRAKRLACECDILPAEIVASNGIGKCMLSTGRLKEALGQFRQAADGYEQLYRSLPAFVWGENTEYLEVVRRLVSLNVRLGNEVDAVHWFQKLRLISAQRIQSFASLTQNSSKQSRMSLGLDLKYFSKPSSQTNVLEMSRDPIIYGQSLQFVKAASNLVERFNLSPQIDFTEIASGGEIVGRIQSLLTSNQAVIGYTNVEDELDILTITSDSYGWKRVYVSRAYLAEMIQKVCSDSSHSEVQFDGTKEIGSIDPNELLFKLLFDPIFKVIENRMELTIVPDGDLCAVPLDMLRDKTGRRLVQDHVINYEVSLRDLERTNVLSDPKRRGVLFLGIEDDGVAHSLVFDNNLLEAPSSSRSGTLPGIQKEMTILEDCFGIHLSAIAGSAMSKQRVLSIAPNYALVHIASHGIPNKGDPLNSEISLGGANRVEMESEPGLTPYDVASREWCASVVFISTCGSAEGRNGRGPGGFISAFRYGGAKCVIATLGEIDDNSSATLAKGFYAYLREGKNPAYAMRQAKLDLLHSGFNERLLMPFVVYGSTGKSGLQFEGEVDRSWDSYSLYTLCAYAIIILTYVGVRSKKKREKQMFDTILQREGSE